MPVLLKSDERDAAIRPCSNPDDTAVFPVGFEDSDEAQAVPDGCEPCHGLPGAYAQVPLCSKCGKEKTKSRRSRGWYCLTCKSESQRQYREARAEVAHDTETIPCVCGTEIPRPTSTHKPVCFCSDACRQEVIGRTVGALMKTRRA